MIHITKIFEPIKVLKNVAAKREELYANLGIYTPFDLLYHIPRSYVDYSAPVLINEAELNQNNVVAGTVIQKFPEKNIRRGLSIYKAAVSDGVSTFMIIFYNNKYALNSLEPGKKYLFYGKVSGNLLSREMNAPQFIPFGSDEKLKAVYHLTAGLTNTMVRTNVAQSLKLFADAHYEFMPPEILEENDFCGLEYALNNIHCPENKDAVERARRRLAFDELLNLQLGMRMLRERNREATSGYTMSPDISENEFIQNLPFEMTSAQKQAVNEIAKDMRSSKPMSRLLQGDVGSGKTAVAAAACFLCARNGFQSALMAPTEILAAQHYKTLSSFLTDSGIKVCLLTGSMTQKQKNLVRAEIAQGGYDVIVGTHAIIQKNVEFKNLALVITDEQHRFGVSQRNALAMKGDSPHRLVMSATPIPRTLAMMIYGDLDISIINELPKGRIPVETSAVTGGYRERIYEFIRKKVNEGRQVYIVCSLVEQSESELKSAVEYKETLESEIFPELKVGLLHGKMSSDEKDLVMNDFKEGKVDILVSTTVIEVGVDVPNAAVIVIEDADRFGLSQLHQLRGRVGRGSEKSYCILITENHSEETRNRLRIICSLTDGFKISEEDLKLRGPGDFFGNRQHGLPCLKIADLANDLELFKLAQTTADRIISEDSRLLNEKYAGLRGEVMRLFATAE